MRKHLGSTIAIVLGLILIAAIAAQPQSSLPIAGAVTLLGALAYRSCKRRGLGEVPSTTLRRGLEIATLVAAALVILLQTVIQRRLILDPIPNILPILWVLVAYAIALFRKYPAALAKG